MAAELTIARDKASGHLKHISEVAGGDACGCVCIECGFELQARKGKINAHHFKHNNPDCNLSLETALHKAAKEIIATNRNIMVPEHGLTAYSNPVVEKSWNSFRPDVTIETVLGQLFVEVVVTSYASEAKEKEYSSGKVLCLEIDLSIEDRNINLSELTEKVLFQLNNKKLLNNNKTSKTIQSESSVSSLEWVFALAVTVFGLLTFFRSSKKRT